MEGREGVGHISIFKSRPLGIDQHKRELIFYQKHHTNSGHHLNVKKHNQSVTLNFDGRGRVCQDMMRNEKKTYHWELLTFSLMNSITQHQRGAFGYMNRPAVGLC